MFFWSGVVFEIECVHLITSCNENVGLSPMILSLPKSLIGKAATYTRNQWQALNRYVQDGDLSIDNNFAERAMRPIAIGRKNLSLIHI